MFTTFSPFLGSCVVQKRGEVGFLGLQMVLPPSQGPLIALIEAGGAPSRQMKNTRFLEIPAL